MYSFYTVICTVRLRCNAKNPYAISIYFAHVNCECHCLPLLIIVWFNLVSCCGEAGLGLHSAYELRLLSVRIARARVSDCALRKVV